MNYIKKLQIQNRRLEEERRQMRQKIIDIQVYLMSEKFQNEDYVHVRTDILPKLSQLLNPLEYFDNE